MSKLHWMINECLEDFYLDFYLDNDFADKIIIEIIKDKCDCDTKTAKRILKILEA